MAKITIDLHFVTGGMGSSGKTTALLNALCYFANKKYNVSTSILVFDEARDGIAVISHDEAFEKSGFLCMACNTKCHHQEKREGASCHSL